MNRILEQLGLVAPVLHALPVTPTREPTLAELVGVLADLQRQIRGLQDVEAIKRLKHAYFRGIDSADVELLATLFHPDVEVHFVGGDYEWKLEGRAQYVEAIAENFNAQVVAEHDGHHPEITLLSDTEAEGTWYLHDDFYNLRDKLYTKGSAFYHDRYEKVDGHWLIRSTRYERHYEIVTPMVDDQMPNFTVRYLAKHGRKVSKG